MVTTAPLNAADTTATASLQATWAPMLATTAPLQAALTPLKSTPSSQEALTGQTPSSSHQANVARNITNHILSVKQIAGPSNALQHISVGSRNLVDENTSPSNSQLQNLPPSPVSSELQPTPSSPIVSQQTGDATTPSLKKVKNIYTVLLTDLTKMLIYRIKLEISLRICLVSPLAKAPPEVALLHHLEYVQA